MNDFSIWFSLGFEHIMEPGALDHILFLLVLSAGYGAKHWKTTVLLMLGFTLGHSAAMAFTLFSKHVFRAETIEAAIAASIVLGALLGFFTSRHKFSWPGFLIITLFGCIHGLGFGMSLKSLLGTDSTLWLPLLYFNTGLEVAQLIIVAGMLLFSLFLSAYLRISEHKIKITFLCIAGLSALAILWQRLSGVF